MCYRIVTERGPTIRYGMSGLPEDLMLDALGLEKQGFYGRMLVNRPQLPLLLPSAGAPTYCDDAHQSVIACGNVPSSTCWTSLSDKAGSNKTSSPIMAHCRPEPAVGL